MLEFYRRTPIPEQGLSNGTVSIRLSVYLSVCASVYPSRPTAANPLLRAGDIDRLLHGRHSAAAACGGRKRAVPRCQRTWEAEHRLVCPSIFCTTAMFAILWVIITRTEEVVLFSQFVIKKFPYICYDIMKYIICLYVVISNTWGLLGYMPKCLFHFILKLTSLGESLHFWILSGLSGFVLRFNLLILIYPSLFCLTF